MGKEESACDECNDFMLRNQENEEKGNFSTVLLQGCTNLG
jgi:hypothetical protein